MRNLIERIFLKLGMKEDGAEIFSWLIIVMAIVSSLFSFAVGGKHANESSKCRVQNIGETIFSLPYVAGCNLFKNRYDVKVN